MTKLVYTIMELGTTTRKQTCGRAWIRWQDITQFLKLNTILMDNIMVGFKIQEIIIHISIHIKIQFCMLIQMENKMFSLKQEVLRHSQVLVSFLTQRYYEVIHRYLPLAKLVRFWEIQEKMLQQVHLQHQGFPVSLI